MIGGTLSHYRVIGKLGEGGMGVVYKAVDLELRRAVAVKSIPDKAADHPNARERFLREARAASQLDHVNIGTIFGVEQTAEGRVFIAMANYEGDTLAAAIRRSRLDPPTARDYCTQIARGLAEAHSRGIIRPEVKPSNVIIARGGVLKLVDFGLARLEDVSRIQPSALHPASTHRKPVMRTMSLIDDSQEHTRRLPSGDQSKSKTPSSKWVTWVGAPPATGCFQT